MKTSRGIMYAAAILCSYLAMTCEPARADALVFRDDFSTATLDPGWSVQPGQNTYSLTANPGYLQYNMVSNYPQPPYLMIYREFAGTHWTLDTKVSYDMPDGLGRYQEVSIGFGPFGGLDQLNLISTGFARHRDDGYSIDDVEALVVENGVAPPSHSGSLLSGDTYYVRFVRDGQNMKIQDSPDGSTFTTLWDHDFTTPLGATQTIVLWGTSYFATGSANYDYVQLTVPEPINLDLVVVGNPGNAGELSGTGAGTWPYGGNGAPRICGAVDYTYEIGKYEVTAGQYAAFLNAVAATDTYGLYDTRMGAPEDSWGCNIQRSGSPGSYIYSVTSDWANRPVNYASWGDAARFANWMHNGQPTGAQNASTTEDGSYVLNGATSDAALLGVTRKANATWVIPNEDEWYKAAYHKNDGVTGNYWDYPTRTNSVPGRDMTEATNPGNNANYYGDPFPIDSPYYTTMVGEFELSVSPYGTFDQGGNVIEWNEAVIDGLYRGLRGASFFNDYGNYGLNAGVRNVGYYPSDAINVIGFRVAKVHVPDSDNDGVPDLRDNCPATPSGEAVDANGCSCSQLDVDGDGVNNCNDTCPDTPSCATVDASGCPIGDGDGDGVFDGCDQCPDSPPGSWVNRNTGCPTARADLDRDGDVDQTDLALFQRCFSGPSVAADPDCVK